MTENPNFAAVFEAGGKFRALPILLGFSPYRLLGVSAKSAVGRQRPRCRALAIETQAAGGRSRPGTLLSWLRSWSLRTAATRALSVAGSTRGGGFLRPR